MRPDHNKEEKKTLEDHGDGEKCPMERDHFGCLYEISVTLNSDELDVSVMLCKDRL